MNQLQAGSTGLRRSLESEAIVSLTVLANQAAITLSCLLNTRDRYSVSAEIVTKWKVDATCRPVAHLAKDLVANGLERFNTLAHVERWHSYCSPPPISHTRP